MNPSEVSLKSNGQPAAIDQRERHRHFQMTDLSGNAKFAVEALQLGLEALELLQLANRLFRLLRISALRPGQARRDQLFRLGACRPWRRRPLSVST